MTAAEQTRVNTLIRAQMDHVNGSLVRRDVAEAIFSELSAEQVRGLAIEGITQRVGKIAASMRPEVRLNGGGSSPSARWDTAKQARDILDDFWVGFQDRPGKHLLDCTAQDCADAADDYRYRAETNAARADSFRKLAAKVRKSKAEVVADLDRDEVRRLFNA